VQFCSAILLPSHSFPSLREGNFGFRRTLLSFEKVYQHGNEESCLVSCIFHLPCVLLQCHETREVFGPIVIPARHRSSLRALTRTPASQFHHFERAVVGCQGLSVAFPRPMNMAGHLVWKALVRQPES
jgi:hypothetical protein